jgi:hypothetical protein
VNVSSEFRCEGSVATPIKALAGLAPLRKQQTISGTGATPITPGVDTVIIDFDGAANPVLYSPVLYPGRRVRVVAKAVQTGTTTVGTAAGSIDGSGSITGPGFREYESDGTNWLQVA